MNIENIINICSIVVSGALSCILIIITYFGVKIAKEHSKNQKQANHIKNKSNEIFINQHKQNKIQNKIKIITTKINIEIAFLNIVYKEWKNNHDKHSMEVWKKIQKTIEKLEEELEKELKQSEKSI